MSKSQNPSIANISLEIIDLQTRLLELQRERDNISTISFEEAKDSVGIRTPGYRSRTMVSEDIKLVQAKIRALEERRDEVQEARKREEKHTSLEKPKHKLVQEEYEKVRLELGYEPGQNVSEVLEQVAENLGENLETVKSAYYYKPKKEGKTPSK